MIVSTEMTARSCQANDVPSAQAGTSSESTCKLAVCRHGDCRPAAKLAVPILHPSSSSAVQYRVTPNVTNRLSVMSIIMLLMIDLSTTPLAHRPLETPPHVQTHTCWERLLLHSKLILQVESPLFLAENCP
ncbi:MAG TPA: hypothetical protein PKN13_01465 [Accumulibacter sp.]|nr:hypothetical protein [Accumulibacter sp.]HNM74000.1 hypothetical protein [Accumulibacter sp.]HNO56341.1 hypothetical protein [Accumulibacter sp.]